MGNPVVHFEIQSKDASKLQKFYSEVFGWTVDTNNPMNYGMINTGGGGIPGGIGAAQGNALVTFYISVDDLAGSLKRVEEYGGRTLMPPTDLPNVSIAMFADPEGHPIGLVKGM